MEQKPGKLISILYRYGNSFLDNRLSEYDFNTGHMSFLLTISSQPNLSQDELSQELGMDKTTTSRVIKQLQERGYVTRHQDQRDRRINRLSLTNRGHKIIPDIQVLTSSWREVLFDGFSEQERNCAMNLLRKMAENAAKIK